MKNKENFKFHIHYVDKNLIFNNKSCIVGFKLNGFEYSLLNNNKKLRILDNLT